jgi:dimethylargininase
VLIAITRPVSASLAQCELTHQARLPIDVGRARRQHAAYEQTLRSLGATLIQAPEAPELPDAVFIEDTAIVLDEVAVMARPGAASRRKETGPVASLLSAYRPLHQLEPPATLDGGDVLRMGRTLYVGLSSRTNRLGAAQLGEMLEPMGYAVVGVPVTGCLHLKSAVTQVADGLLLLNPGWVAPATFSDCEFLPVADQEPGAANALYFSGAVIYPAHFPDTAERLVRHGLKVVPVECGELAKAEGGVTCCSLLFEASTLAT